MSVNKSVTQVVDSYSANPGFTNHKTANPTAIQTTAITALPASQPPKDSPATTAWPRQAPPRTLETP